MRQISGGSTDITLLIYIQDTSDPDGAGLTGLVYNSSGLTCYYDRGGATAVQLTLATQTVTGAHTDGGFVEVDSTNMPGIYRLDLSDAIIASGVDEVSLLLQGAADMAATIIGIQIT